VILLALSDYDLTATLDTRGDGYLLKGCPTGAFLVAIRRPPSLS
jgi:hypothetical protein